MSRYRISRSTPESNVGLTVAALLVVALATLPWWDGDGSLRTPLVTVLLYRSRHLKTARTLISIGVIAGMVGGFSNIASI